MLITIATLFYIYIYNIIYNVYIDMLWHVQLFLREVRCPDRNVNVDFSSHIILDLGALYASWLGRVVARQRRDMHCSSGNLALIFLILNSYHVYINALLHQSFETDSTFPHMNPFHKQLDELLQLACERNLGESLDHVDSTFNELNLQVLSDALRLRKEAEP